MKERKNIILVFSFQLLLPGENIASLFTRVALGNNNPKMVAIEAMLFHLLTLTEHSQLRHSCSHGEQ